ncbi:hypothetical protein AX774_g5074 [Zancudomyces culisetae]|uniref:Uncharacterized protein n=1 Tax=Zancudomyces culisetae TaxID=1213189 RepID=A0A1R1PKL6_ZANCU|nr:hypothetical protein AX774_g5074 [Zancudomyces culisetae]|eukprot:OMH81479.1 hypothetical protein AX774_g5074 [Zancudomyces culisetae]
MNQISRCIWAQGCEDKVFVETGVNPVEMNYKQIKWDESFYFCVPGLTFANFGKDSTPPLPQPVVSFIPINTQRPRRTLSSSLNSV